MKNDTTERDVGLLTSVLDNFVSLFKITDLDFFTLQILDLAPDEMEIAEKGILKLEKMWKKLDSNILPRCHIVFDHTMDQVRKYNVIADIVEDFIKQSHQTRKELDHLVACMESQWFCQQELVKKTTLVACK